MNMPRKDRVNRRALTDISLLDRLSKSNLLAQEFMRHNLPSETQRIMIDSGDLPAGIDDRFGRRFRESTKSQRKGWKRG